MKKTNKSQGFNSPFAKASDKLAALVRPTEDPPKAGERSEPWSKEVLSDTKPTATEKPPVNAPPPVPETRPVSDEQMFADHMAGVTPMAHDPRGRLGAPAPPAGARPVSRRAADEAEAYAQLADLVDGHGPFSISDTDEYLEFLAPGIDRRLLRKLRAGEYALQGHVDLHGMNREQARAAVERFVEQSRLAQHRCVLIVHGRGLNSKDQIPVLKEAVKSWLERGRLGRQVLAFATARPCDGGAGALYVLLRR